MAVFNKGLIIVGLFVISFLTNGLSQDIEWLVKPIISDVDTKIQFYPEIDLVSFVNDKGLKGVKNFDNEVVIPFEYESFYIVQEVDFIKAYREDSTFYFDRKGKPIFPRTPEFLEKHAEMVDAGVGATNRKEQLIFDDFNETQDNFVLRKLGEDEKRCCLLNDKGDTLVYALDRPSSLSLVNKKYIIAKFQDGFYRVIDKDGKVYFESKNHIGNVEFHERDWTTFSQQNRTVLMDENMQVMLEQRKVLEVYADVGLLKTREEGGVFLYDSTFNKIHGRPSTHLVRWNDSNQFYIGYSDQATIYNTGTKELKEMDFYFDWFNKVSPLQVAIKDSLYGIYDFVRNSLVVPIEYKSMRKEGDFFIASTGNEIKDDKKLYDYLVFDREGKIFIETQAAYVNLLAENAFLFYDENWKSFLYNNEGKLVLESEERLIKTKSPYWLKQKEESRSSAYFVKDLLIGKNNQIPKIEKFLKATTAGAEALTIVSGEKGKHGVMNSEGELIIPMIYDEISNKEIDEINYLMVVKEGKYGLMKRPQ